LARVVNHASTCPASTSTSTGTGTADRILITGSRTGDGSGFHVFTNADNVMTRLL
jgi:hypothetical protein